VPNISSKHPARCHHLIQGRWRPVRRWRPRSLATRAPPLLQALEYAAGTGGFVSRTVLFALGHGTDGVQLIALADRAAALWEGAEASWGGGSPRRRGFGGSPRRRHLGRQRLGKTKNGAARALVTEGNGGGRRVREREGGS